MDKKILIIDDDATVLKNVGTWLKKEGFEVLTATDGRKGLRTAFNTHPDLVVLDIVIPGMDGLDVCQRLLELTDLPIILLTGLAESADVVKGLSLGADDYITKPFDLAELTARVRTCLRRREFSGSTGNPVPVLSIGDLTVDFARHKVTLRGKRVDLTPTEFRLISLLARRPGHVIPHRNLLIEVWGPEYDKQIDYLHLYMSYLRQKIERNPSKPEIIKTERGVGYYLEEVESRSGKGG